MIKTIRYDEVIGKNKKNIFNKIGLIAKSTDYAEYQADNSYGYILSGSVKSNSFYELDNVVMVPKATVINSKGQTEYKNLNNPFLGIRLSGNYSDIKNQSKVVEVLENGIKVVEYGEYPTTLTFEIQGQKTYDFDKEKMLLETGKTYWVPNLKAQSFLCVHLEPYARHYENEEEYIEIKEYVDSEGNKYVEYESLYYKVEPVRWYVDEEEDYIVSVNTIAGGLPYGSYYQMFCSELEYTYSVDYFVQNKLVKNLISSEIYELPGEYIQEPKQEELIPIVSLPNLDDLNREQLEALQAQIAQILTKKNDNQNRSLLLKP